MRVRVRELDAGDFAFVMATGIVSATAFLRGLPVLSDVLLAVACAGWIVLAAALVTRLSRGRGRRPRLQSCAVVAATAVLGARFMLDGFGLVAMALWALALLLYAVVLLRQPALEPLTGGSLLLVVATESLAALACLLALRWSAGLLDVALAAWVLGLVLYPAVVAALAVAQRRCRRFAPDLWIVMGALAIATLAGTELLVAGRERHTLAGMTRLLPDVDLATWTLATALVLPLVAVELRARRSWRFEAARWSFVFPLGMYSAASMTLGQADRVGLLISVGRAAFVLALAAWTVVSLGLVRRIRPV